MEKRLKITSRMLRSEEGSMTVLGLFIFMFVAMVGAVALDFGQLYSARTQLQVLADQVGHAAIYQRWSKTEAQAKVDAVALATATVAPSRYGEPIKVTDIKFGTFDNATGVFTETANSKDAVKVIASFTAGRDNAAPSYLFKLVGFASFDIVVESVWQAYYPDCLNEGLVAVGKVDVRGNNSFGAGFCLHSNSHIEIQNGNNFELGSTVSMPDKSDLVSGGFSSNTGLEDALQDGFMNLRVLSRLETFRTGLLTGDPKIIPSYITDHNPISVTKQNFDATEFLPGRIYNVSCPGTRINIRASSSPLDRVVIVTDCKISFESNS
ncbi:MAG: Tad domain-containing protein [Yoonia sp.]|nr:Tad domain-containing protein [Yoonia sp.]